MSRDAVRMLRSKLILQRSILAKFSRVRISHYLRLSPIPERRHVTVSSVPNLPAPFTILSIAPPLPATLQPNDKLTVTIQYTGTTGVQTSKVFAFATLPCAASDSIALKGEGEVSAQPSFTATKSLKTDSICIGKDTLLTARLTNTGGVNLQVQQALASGSADFTVLGFAPRALASGDNMDVQVRYAPSAVGQATGKVVWVTDLLK
jgi:hypothetical protein